MDYETEWDINLRTNLRLWPEPAPNVAALAKQFGQPYDEEALIQGFPSAAGKKAPTDTRAVRNTFEALAYAGLAHRTGGDPDRLEATSLGASTLSFVGATGTRNYATEANRHLLGVHLIAGLSVLIECRVVWRLMTLCGDVLTNEELNRCMARIDRLSDVEDAAAAVEKARAADDPTEIGPRTYKPDDYGTDSETDQRKAMNPHFLLAGGGGWFIELGEDGVRRLLPWAVRAIDSALSEDVPLTHASTSKETVLRVARHASPPGDWRGY